MPITSNARAFTLLEVLVAMTILAVAIIGVLQIFSQSVQAAARARHLNDAVVLAQNQLVIATSGLGGSKSAQSGDSNQYHWQINYEQKSDGVELASVVVTWPEQGSQQTFQLSQAFIPPS